MPKGIKGFQKGHKTFITKKTYQIIGKKTKKRMQKICSNGEQPEWLKDKGFQKGHKLQVGENHWGWKGDKVGKAALHDWVKHRLGKPNKCEHCKSIIEKRYEWANISQKYKRDLKDWIRLCSKCHHKYDNQIQKAWITRRKNTKLYSIY